MEPVATAPGTDALAALVVLFLCVFVVLSARYCRFYLVYIGSNALVAALCIEAIIFARNVGEADLARRVGEEIIRGVDVGLATNQYVLLEYCAGKIFCERAVADTRSRACHTVL